MLGPGPINSFTADDASRSANEASNKAEQADRHFRELEARLNRLVLVNQAMWSLIKEKTSVSETELLSHVCELELHQQNAAAVQCSGCGRTIPTKRHRCIYCGHTEPVDSIFQTL